MASEDYKIASAKKLAANAAKIPEEWRLPSEYLKDVHADSHINVLNVPRSCGILSKDEVAITEDFDATALLDQIATKQFSSHEVVLAFCKRAAIAHQLANCLTEIMFEEALSRARLCDEFLETHGRTMGPLHGLPISIKDSFNIKGYQTIMGYAAFASSPPATNNSAIVDILLQAGAVVYVKTNVPQTLMSADTENNVFGRTLNPYKLSLNAGGSSGGEGALLKLRGSVLGVGTDLAGSVRIPAFCNGIFALNPSAKRVPYGGELWDSRLGTPSQVPSSVGPMGHSPRDMELFMKVVADAEPWKYDETAINVPWRQVSQPSNKLKLGLILEDHEKRPLHPPMLRAMTNAREALIGAGHKIVPINHLIPSLWYTATQAWRYFSLDPRKTGYSLMNGDPLIKSIQKPMFEENKGWEATLDALWDLNLERGRILSLYRDIVVENQLDGIIMPPYQSTAQPHDLYGAVPYTVLANFLNYPAAQIPYLTADKEQDREFIRHDVAYEPAYDPDAIEGAPIGIQVLGLPMKDEELIHMMSIVSSVLVEPTKA